MKQASLRFSDGAVGDILDQAEWYERQSGQSLARRWERAVSSTVLRIEKNPNAGSPCRFSSLEAQRIRRMGIKGFPKHLIFYRLEKRDVLVLRVAHGARDLESLF